MSRHQILVVDDDQFFREMTRAELRAVGFDVSHATDVESARQAIAGGSADAMLPDYLLPDGTATDVWAFTLQENPRLAGRTVVITGALEETERKALELGLGTPVLAKPFEPEVLIHLPQRVATGLE